MPSQPHSQLIEDQRLQRPQTQFEYVTVTFTAANTDTLIPYTVLRPNSPDTIRWTDVRPTGVWNGASDDLPVVYRSGSPSRRPFTSAHIVLRSSVAAYTTRLLLFLERSSET